MPFGAISFFGVHFPAALGGVGEGGAGSLDDASFKMKDGLRIVALGTRHVGPEERAGVGARGVVGGQNR